LRETSPDFCAGDKFRRRFFCIQVPFHTFPRLSSLLPDEDSSQERREIALSSLPPVLSSSIPSFRVVLKRSYRPFKVALLIFSFIFVLPRSLASLVEITSPPPGRPLANDSLRIPPKPRFSYQLLFPRCLVLARQVCKTDCQVRDAFRQTARPFPCPFPSSPGDVLILSSSLLLFVLMILILTSFFSHFQSSIPVHNPLRLKI